MHAVEGCLGSTIAQVAAEVKQPAGHKDKHETASAVWDKQLLLDSVGLCCSLSQQVYLAVHAVPPRDASCHSLGAPIDHLPCASCLLLQSSAIKRLF